MAHFNLPPGGDPTTAAWLGFSRQRRRAAMHQARSGLRRDQPALTKDQRRLATPWQPILVPPSDAYLLSGRKSSEQAAMIRRGMNRLARRAALAPRRTGTPLP